MKGGKMNITKKEYDKEYYLKNKEHRLQQAQEWRSRNKEKLKIWQHEYYLKNRKQNLEIGPANHKDLMESWSCPPKLT